MADAPRCANCPTRTATVVRVAMTVTPTPAAVAREIDRVMRRYGRRSL